MAVTRLDDKTTVDFYLDSVNATIKRLKEGSEDALSTISSAIVEMVGLGKQQLACEIVGVISSVYFALNDSNHYKVTQDELVKMLQSTLKSVVDTSGDNFISLLEENLFRWGNYLGLFNDVQDITVKDEDLEEFFAIITTTL